jgi:hypothetical protein
MYSTKLSEALTAMQAIRDTADMHILASEYNRHIAFLGKLKAQQFAVVKGDTIGWEYGGIEKFGKVYKVNTRTVYVTTSGIGGTNKVKVDKSLIIGKVAA